MSEDDNMPGRSVVAVALLIGVLAVAVGVPNWLGADAGQAVDNSRARTPDEKVHSEVFEASQIGRIPGLPTLIGATTSAPVPRPAASTTDNAMAVDADPTMGLVDAEVARQLTESLDVSINITDVTTPWAAWQAKLQYDPSVLEFVPVGPDGWTYTGLGGATLDFGVTESDSDGDTVNDSVWGGAIRTSGTTDDTGQAALVRFTCLAVGTSLLHLGTLAEDPAFGTTTIEIGGTIISTGLTDAAVHCLPPEPGLAVAAVLPMEGVAAGVAVNPNTNRIYVTRSGEDHPCREGDASDTSSSPGRVSVIDGFTNAEIDTDGDPANGITPITVGHYPWGVGVNPTTNRVYVPSQNRWPCDPGGPADVRVIDGVTNAVVETIVVTPASNYTSLTQVAVNPYTDRVYLAGSRWVPTEGGAFIPSDYSALWEIDGAANVLAGAVPLGGRKWAHNVAINPTTNRIYVLNVDTPKSLSIVDASTSTVVDTISPGDYLSLLRPGGPTDVAVNSTTGRVYMATRGTPQSQQGWVWVMDETLRKMLGVVEIESGHPEHIVVNPAANRIYVTHGRTWPRLSVIDGATNTVVDTVSLVSRSSDLAVNPTTNRIYVTHPETGDVTVVQDVIPNELTVVAPDTPQAIGTDFAVEIAVTAAPSSWNRYRVALRFDSSVLEYVPTSDIDGDTVNESWEYTSIVGTLFRSPVYDVRDDPEVKGGGAWRLGRPLRLTGTAIIATFRCVADGVSPLTLVGPATDPVFGTLMFVRDVSPVLTEVVHDSVTCGTPSHTPTPTSSPVTLTETPTPTPFACTPPFTPVVAGDSDCDGAPDDAELGPDPVLCGTRDPNDPWDFYDVPVPTLHVGGTMYDRDSAVSLFNDALAVLEYSGTIDDGPPTTAGRDYDDDRDGDGYDDGIAYDRDVGAPWPELGLGKSHSGPPDGAVTLFDDVLLVLDQSGHGCPP